MDPMSNATEIIKNPITNEVYEVVATAPKTAEFQFGYCGVSYFHMPSGRRIATVKA